jgi:hypothetical protein
MCSISGNGNGDCCIATLARYPSHPSSRGRGLIDVVFSRFNDTSSVPPDVNTLDHSSNLLPPDGDDSMSMPGRLPLAWLGIDDDWGNMLIGLKFPSGACFSNTIITFLPPSTASAHASHTSHTCIGAASMRLKMGSKRRMQVTILYHIFVGICHAPMD